MKRLTVALKHLLERGLFRHCPKSGRRIGLNMRPWWAKVLIPVFGFIALAWYLLRVTAKPSRATYPCMQVAAPLAFSFIGWLLSIGVVSAVVRWGTEKLKRRMVWILVLACCGVYVTLGQAFAPSDPVNAPIGIAKGIFPGRVTWVHDPSATIWDGSTGYWWAPQNTNQAVVNKMMADTVCALTGQSDVPAAWNALFRYYNQSKGKGNVGFAQGEKIVIKANLNSGGGTDNRVDSSPHVAYALFDHLVNVVGVPQDDILIYDAQRVGISAIRNYCSPDFPNVKYNAWGHWVANQIAWSRPSRNDALSQRLPSAVLQAEYLINFAILKRHSDNVGITGCGKNHFGTIGSPSDMHGVISDRNRPRSYNPNVDIIGSKHMGGKTLLYLIDGLYSGYQHNSEPMRWNMAPFNGHWPSSIMASLDPVAIDSVALDFLRTEWELSPNADNYLHEAAHADNPPSGTHYAPDGTRLSSLGVHEHWNNPIDRQYSRNLGTGNGIELIHICATMNQPPEETLGLMDGSGTSQQPNSLDATRFVAESSFYADTMHARFTDTSASGVMRMAIYAHGGGAPGAVLGDTAEFAAGSGLRSSALNAPVRITEGNVYWIATWVQLDGSALVTYVANNGVGTRYRAEPAYSATASFPDGSDFTEEPEATTYAVFATGTLPICAYDLLGDLDDNCIVDFADVAMMAQNWLVCTRIDGDCP